MLKVGLSTGCVHKAGLGVNEAIKLYRSLGANAIEISFGHSPELSGFNLTQELIQEVRKYDFVSLHGPWDIRYGKNEKTQEIIDKLGYVFENLKAHGIVVHPDTVDSFYILQKSGLPFLIENMDTRKEFGTSPGDFKRLKKGYGFGFVLDVKHAGDHDSSMKLGRELLDIMDSRLKYFHVSGSDHNGRHVPTYSVGEKEGIIKILESRDVPRISEGCIDDNVRQTVLEELAFLRSI